MMFRENNQPNQMMSNLKEIRPKIFVAINKKFKDKKTSSLDIKTICYSHSVFTKKMLKQTNKNLLAKQ